MLWYSTDQLGNSALQKIATKLFDSILLIFHLKEGHFSSLQGWNIVHF